jgi:PIN domain nuclease of toxin-antitoxin system
MVALIMPAIAASPGCRDAGRRTPPSWISVWEVAKRVEQRQLVLDRALSDWLDAARARPGLELVELTRTILEESCRLPPPFHGDPADQMVVATARDRDAVIVTRDGGIRAYPHVRSAW